MSGPALLADIGGTNARFALCLPGERPGEAVLRTGADFPRLEDAVADVLAVLDGDVREAVFAVAGPVDGSVAQLSNSPWRADAEALARRFGWRRCRLINDFAANALSLPLLGAADVEAIGGGRILDDRPKVVLGPGTGLGVAGLVPSAEGWLPVPGEGGHATLAADDDFQARLISALREEVGHVSRESVLCGPGWLHGAIVAVMGEAAGGDRVHPRSPEEITRAAREQPGGSASQAIAVFNRMLGAYAGDLALIFGAAGGVYLAGGVLAALGELFDRAAFRRRFEAKGPFSDYQKEIATLMITAQQPGLLGLSALLRPGENVG